MKVMGPDEFHEKYQDTDEGGLKDNAYTNLMAALTSKERMELATARPQPDMGQLTPCDAGNDVA